MQGFTKVSSLKTTIQTKTVLVPAASAVNLLGPSPYRVAVILSAPTVNRITLSFDASAVLDSGITLYPAQSPLELYREFIGSALEQPISAISAVADQLVGITEVIIAP